LPDVFIQTLTVRSFVVALQPKKTGSANAHFPGFIEPCQPSKVAPATVRLPKGCIPPTLTRIVRYIAAACAMEPAETPKTKIVIGEADHICLQPLAVIR
jgi:hypothetical protein